MSMSGVLGNLINKVAAEKEQPQNDEVRFNADQNTYEHQGVTMTAQELSESLVRIPPPPMGNHSDD